MKKNGQLGNFPLVLVYDKDSRRLALKGKIGGGHLRVDYKVYRALFPLPPVASHLFGLPSSRKSLHVFRWPMEFMGHVSAAVQECLLRLQGAVADMTAISGVINYYYAVHSISFFKELYFLPVVNC
jgi:hypothetical protein